MHAHARTVPPAAAVGHDRQAPSRTSDDSSRNGRSARGPTFPAVVLTATVLLSGCAGTPTTPSHSSTPTTTAVPGHPATDGRAYASTDFVVPFDVTPPSWLGTKPVIEQPHFVTWDAPDLPAVRFLAPVSVYRPGQHDDDVPPTDYLPYLLDQANHGAHFADQTNTTVGGQPATLVTATTTTSLDGSLGCPTMKTPAAECFGLQPQVALRIAVIKVHGATVLVWLRTPTTASASDTKTRAEEFESMLAGLRFSDRSPSTPTATPSSDESGRTPVDGNYVMSISWPKTKANHPAARCVGGPESTSPQTVYELVLDRGTIRLGVRIGGPQAALEPAYSGTFRVEGNRFIFGDSGSAMTTTFTLTNKNGLTLTNLQGGQCGDVAIWTTKPWIRRP